MKGIIWTLVQLSFHEIRLCPAYILGGIEMISSVVVRVVESTVLSKRFHIEEIVCFFMSNYSLGKKVLSAERKVCFFRVEEKAQGLLQWRSATLIEILSESCILT